jgi:hypothetical protein
VRFFLVFNSKLKIFHYVLDETVKVADEFFPFGRSGRILAASAPIAFYRDHRPSGKFDRRQPAQRHREQFDARSINCRTISSKQSCARPPSGRSHSKVASIDLAASPTATRFPIDPMRYQNSRTSISSTPVPRQVHKP